jgi:hypothetical protein
MHTHSPNKPKRFEQTSARKLMAFVFWYRNLCNNHNNVRSVLPNTKKLRRAIQNNRRGMLTFGVVLLHDNARPHTAVRTWALLVHFNWELFDYPPCSPDLASSDYHLCTYMKNWLESQSLNNNELMEGVEAWLSWQAANFFDTGIQKLFPDTTSASNQAVTTLRSSCSVYVFLCNNFFSLFC